MIQLDCRKSPTKIIIKCTYMYRSRYRKLKKTADRGRGAVPIPCFTSFLSFQTVFLHKNFTIIIIQFQKKSIPTQWKVNENSKEVGDLKAKVLKGKQWA